MVVTFLKLSGLKIVFGLTAILNLIQEVIIVLLNFSTEGMTRRGHVLDFIKQACKALISHLGIRKCIKRGLLFANYLLTI